jgi:hypothetical protein
MQPMHMSGKSSVMAALPALVLALMPPQVIQAQSRLMASTRAHGDAPRKPAFPNVSAFWACRWTRLPMTHGWNSFTWVEEV